jgi:pimeloyl-ACP methyl ester carboxylesterase
MRRPRTQYAKCGGLNIAYQVIGEGPLDVIFVPGWVSNIDFAWTSPRLAHVFERLSSFARLILFDKRGTGLSDRNVGFPTLEDRMEDVHAVMDAAGSRRAALIGTSEGGNMSMLFAATYPDRTVALVLHGCFAKGVWAEDYPWAKTREETEKELAAIERDWGGPFDLSNASPSLANDESEREWAATYLRNAASPSDAIALWRWNNEIDVRDILPSIHVPTLILHRSGDRWVKIEEGRYLAEHIKGANYVELPGNDHVIWAGDTDRVLEEIEEFLTGVRPPKASERVLLTVLFTDIVGSTSMAAELGDRRWKELLQRHDDAVRAELRRHDGMEVKTTGDGFLVAFYRPTRAIQCANAIQGRMAGLGLKIRAALHIGECEKRGQELSGIAIHLASRLLDHAQAGDVVASRTVKDLVVGAGITFEERGEATLRDIPGTWQIFSIGANSN